MNNASRLIALLAIGLLARSAAAHHIWINEFHYDNAGLDAGEFIEIAVRSGPGHGAFDTFSASNYKVLLYNTPGGESLPFERGLLTIPATGPFPIAGSSETVTLYTIFYSGEIPNGGTAGSGIALIDIRLPPPVAALEFISYEGAFTATDNSANGVTSIDVGVFEDGTATGTSISRIQGGDAAKDFVWALSPTATPGAINLGQSLNSVPEPAALGVACTGLLALAARRRRVV
jgi:uncharacterized protein